MFIFYVKIIIEPKIQMKKKIKEKKNEAWKVC